MEHKTSEIEINYRPKVYNESRIIESGQAFEVLLENWDKNTINLFEEFKILLLDNSNEVLGVLSLFKGGVRTCLKDVKILFSLVLKSSAQAIITCHNKPLGRVKPNKSDIEIYNKIKEMSEHHKINYLDNLIITESRKYSFADEGFLC